MSRTTWWLSASSAGLWLTLGLVEGDGPTVLWAVCTGLVAATILARTTAAARPDHAPGSGCSGSAAPTVGTSSTPTKEWT